MATQSGLSGISQDISPGIKAVGGINLYGVDDSEQKKLLESLDTGVAALRARYDNPNYFKVAAAFAKPQLGGFMASLGSAAEVMGENVEQQRANELPVFNANSQAAAMRVALAQKANAAGLAEKALTKPGGLTAADVADITHRDEERGKIAQAQFLNEQSLRKEIMDAHAAGRSDAELLARYGRAFAFLFPEGTPKVAAIPLAAIPLPAPGAAPGTAPAANPETPSESATGSKSLAAVTSVPPGVDMTLAEFKQLPLADQNRLKLEGATKNQAIEFDTVQKYADAAKIALPNIQNFKTMRELAAPSDPKLAAEMDKAFNILGGNDAVSLLGKALSQGRLTDRLANIDGLLVQAGVKTPEVRRRIAELGKLINENKQASNNGQSVTDAATELRGASNPSFDNPRDAFVSLTDALALRERHRYNQFDVLKGRTSDNKNYTAQDFIISPEYKNLESAYSETKSQIFNNVPTSKTPEFYNLSSSAPAAPAKSAATRVSPSGWVKQPDGSFKKAE